MGGTIVELARASSNSGRERFAAATTSSTDGRDVLLNLAREAEAAGTELSTATPGGAGTLLTEQAAPTLCQSIKETIQSTMQFCLNQSISVVTKMTASIWFGMIPSGMAGDSPSSPLMSPGDSSAS